MSDSDSSKKSDTAGDDPIVEIPSVSGNKYIRKSQISKLDIRSMVVHCTCCSKQINHLDNSKFKKHFRLGVVVCTDCYEFYGESDFSQDESGSFNYCTWCGNGGKLLLCDFCSNSFCLNCIRRNFGRAEIKKTSEKDWKCYCCEPKKLEGKAEYCKILTEFMASMKKKEQGVSQKKKIDSQDFPKSCEWIVPTFDTVEESCKALLKKFRKLKAITASQSKSLKHIVSKMDDLVTDLKKNLSSCMKNCVDDLGAQTDKAKNSRVKKTRNVVESSSSICLSSSEEESDSTKKKKTLSKKARKGLLTSSDSSSSENFSGDDVAVVRKIFKRAKKADSDSSEGFQPQKKRKYDKLLSFRIISDDESGKGNKKKTANKKKRRVLSSSSDEETTYSPNTYGKGRKNINNIISSKDLAKETKEAEEKENERRRRVRERQNQYNVIKDVAVDGPEITRKFVLEVDPTSKNEIVEISPALVKKLKPHQINGVKFMWECTIESVEELEKNKGSGCILPNCKGPGKTLQVITFLHTCLTNKHVKKKIRTAMVICPCNTVSNWSREFEQRLNEIDDTVEVHHLTMTEDNVMRHDIIKDWYTDGGVLIISYDVFRRLGGDKKIPKLDNKLRREMQEHLIDPGPDIVICDEGHMLKNVNTTVSKVFVQLKSERRVFLTGIPLQKNLQEYYCMMSFVKPNLLGTVKEFKNRFLNPIMNGQYEDSTTRDVNRMRKRIHMLHKLLEGCVQW